MDRHGNHRTIGLDQEAFLKRWKPGISNQFGWRWIANSPQGAVISPVYPGKRTQKQILEQDMLYMQDLFGWCTSDNIAGFFYNGERAPFFTGITS